MKQCAVTDNSAYSGTRDSASYATHLLEQKVDIRVIQVLLGHKKLESTALYTQVATKILREVVSPLDSLHPL